MDVFDDNSSEALILVDADDNGIGYMDKSACHEGRGILHRAFSLLIFNDKGDLLIQQRAASKRLWPLYWSNSCCSHPRSNETLEIATKRRLREELGIECPLQYLFKFQYQAQFDASGAENELCSVFIGGSAATPTINKAEINDWRWVSPQALQNELAAQGDRAFTPWFMLEWTRIWRDHRPAVLSLVI